jgi:sulfur-carrier protein
MSLVKVTLTANLQKYYPQAKFDMSASSVKDLLKKMDEVRPYFSAYILEDNGAIRKHVNIFINGEVVRDKSHVEIPLEAGTQVHIMQALSGG